MIVLVVSIDFETSGTTETTQTIIWKPFKNKVHRAVLKNPFEVRRSDLIF